MATREIRTSDKLFTLEVRLEAQNGRLDRSDGRIELSVRTTEVLTSARFGDKLAPGAFLFPSGLRLAVEQTSMCDFDPSAPCPFGGSYRAHASLGDQEAHVEIKTARTTILGHVLEMGRGTEAGPDQPAEHPGVRRALDPGRCADGEPDRLHGQQHDRDA